MHEQKKERKQLPHGSLKPVAAAHRRDGIMIEHVCSFAAQITAPGCKVQFSEVARARSRGYAPTRVCALPRVNKLSSTAWSVCVHWENKNPVVVAVHTVHSVRIRFQGACSGAAARSTAFAGTGKHRLFVRLSGKQICRSEWRGLARWQNPRTAIPFSVPAAGERFGGGREIVYLCTTVSTTHRVPAGFFFRKRHI